MRCDLHRSKPNHARQKLAKKSADALACTLLDELFNLRGTVIHSNPGRHLTIFLHAVVKQDSAVLFVDKTQVADAVITNLAPVLLRMRR